MKLLLEVVTVSGLVKRPFDQIVIANGMIRQLLWRLQRNESGTILHKGNVYWLQYLEILLSGALQ